MYTFNKKLHNGRCDILDLSNWLKCKEEEGVGDMISLYDWLKLKKEEHKGDDEVILIDERTEEVYRIIVNDPYSRDPFYAIVTTKGSSYYQISYLLRDVDKKLLSSYCVTKVKILNPGSLSGDACYRVMIKGKDLANQKKEGDNRDMKTLHDWLIHEKAQGNEDYRVTLMYTDSIFKNKKACIKPKPYGYSGHYMSTIIDEKRPEYYTIDYLLRFIEREFLRSYYVTCEGLVKDPYSTNNHRMAYKLEVSDNTLPRPSSSNYNTIEPFRIDPPLVRQYNDNDARITLDVWNRFLYGEKHLEIKKVTFSGPATIVFWSDGTKTVVKCDKDDVLDYEKGILYAVLKKLSNKEGYNDILRVIDALSCIDDDQHGPIKSGVEIEYFPEEGAKE